MIDAETVISAVEVNTGALEGNRKTRPIVISAVRQAVLGAQHEFGDMSFPVTIATAEDVGEYALGAQYRSIRSIKWPQDWYNYEAAGPSHTLPSDITSDFSVYHDGPRYITRPDYLSLLQRSNALGSSGESVYAWTYWRDANNVLYIGLVDPDYIEAGETIVLYCEIMSSVDYVEGDTIALPTELEQWLIFRATEIASMRPPLRNRETHIMYKQLRIEEEDLVNRREYSHYNEPRFRESRWFPPLED